MKKLVTLHALAIALSALFATQANAQEVIKIGCPTKTYFPTILATVAKEKGLFEKEGLKPEITIYRGGGDHVAADPAFGYLKQRGGFFYDGGVQGAPPAPPAGPLPYIALP